MVEGIGKVNDVYGIIGDTENLHGTLEEDVDDYVAEVHSENVGYHVEKYVPANNDWADVLVPYPYRANKRKR